MQITNKDLFNLKKKKKKKKKSLACFESFVTAPLNAALLRRRYSICREVHASMSSLLISEGVLFRHRLRLSKPFEELTAIHPARRTK